MATIGEQRDNPTGGPPTSEEFPLKRELIVIARHEVGLRAAREAVVSATGSDVGPLTDLLAAEEVTLQPLFGVSEERLQAKAALLVAETGAEIPDLSVYYQVEAPDERLDELAERFQQLDAVLKLPM